MSGPVPDATIMIAQGKKQSYCGSYRETKKRAGNNSRKQSKYSCHARPSGSEWLKNMTLKVTLLHRSRVLCPEMLPVQPRHIHQGSATQPMLTGNTRYANQLIRKIYVHYVDLCSVCFE